MAERAQGSGQEKENLLRSRAIQFGAALIGAGILFESARVLAVIGLGVVGGKLLHNSWSKHK